MDLPDVNKEADPRSRGCISTRRHEGENKSSGRTGRQRGMIYPCASNNLEIETREDREEWRLRQGKTEWNGD